MFRTLTQTARAAVLALPFAVVSVPQVHGQYDPNRHTQFYDGARRGGNGNYYYGRDHRYDDRYQGHGIGTGRGALIGGAGGAALGALFGGGMKGALIGGAAGAGIGAVAGHAHQNTMKRHYYERRNGYYR